MRERVTIVMRVTPRFSRAIPSARARYATRRCHHFPLRDDTDICFEFNVYAAYHYATMRRAPRRRHYACAHAQCCAVPGGAQDMTCARYMRAHYLFFIYMRAIAAAASEVPEARKDAESGECAHLRARYFCEMRAAAARGAILQSGLD